SVAYRMLGSVADAEDAVQDAFLRYQAAGGVSSTEGFLIRTTTRLCIDRLRERRRKEYVGPWVPEPVETRAERRDTALSESLSQAFLLLLERLTPDERAAFLLRTVFDSSMPRSPGWWARARRRSGNWSAGCGGGSGSTAIAGSRRPRRGRTAWPSG